MIIRQANTKDIPDLVELLKELYSIEKDFKFDARRQKKGLKLLISKPKKTAYVLVAEYKGRCVGMVSAQVVVSTSEGGNGVLIEDMVIRKDYRGRGIGSRLMYAMVSWCKASGIGRMQLLADKNNLPAAHFYKKRGWQSTQLVGYRKYA